MTLAQPPAEPPYDYPTAEALRKQDVSIYGCWYCLNTGAIVKDRPFWPANMVKFIGYLVACPEHYKERA